MNTIKYIITRVSYVANKCPECEGIGKLSRNYHSRSFVYDCPRCEGSGQIMRAKKEDIDLITALNDLGYGKREKN